MMNRQPRKDAMEIFMAAIEAADPGEAVSSEAGRIRLAFESGGYGRMLSVAFGKAASKMTSALEGSLGDLLEKGIAITKYGHMESHSGKIMAFEAGHPLPDENGVSATENALGLLRGADERTLVVCLVSGGGSALLVAPAEGIGLSEKQEITDSLLKAGADINELNSVRKHLSKVKGGRLAKAAYPAKIISLIVSDVVGDALDVIASGPTAPDGSTFGDALAVLKKYSIRRPRSAIGLLERGASGEVAETPKEGDPELEGVENIIVCSNRRALEAALVKAGALGYKGRLFSDSITGEASEAALRLCKEALKATSRPVCIVSGGETTVTVRGKGKGGRNTELALAFALAVKGQKGVTLLSAGTDGTDGPTDAAGALVDGDTVPDAMASGIDAEARLKENDSYGFFKEAGGLVVTGPTGTNVMDLQVMLLT